MERRKCFGTRLGTELRLNLAELKRAVWEVFFGAFLFALYQQVIHTKVKYEDTFYALLFAEFLGFPMTSNYYTIRLLPYVAMELERYRKKLLREVDLLELLHEGPGAH
ncbi:MAG: hypothetical protein RMJ75_04465 [Nitrososphaerota archaeon]|nr:hypothetical protein [Nitrososphaerota archaeon]